MNVRERERERRGGDRQVGEEKGEGRKELGSSHTGSFALRVFICFPRAGILGEISGKDLNRRFISFLVMPFQGPCLY